MPHDKKVEGFIGSLSGSHCMNAGGRGSSNTNNTNNSIIYKITLYHILHSKYNMDFIIVPKDEYRIFILNGSLGSVRT